MKAADVPERAILEAYEAFHQGASWIWEVPALSVFPPKVLWAKVDKLLGRGFLEYGTSIRSAWLTDKGRARLAVLRESE